MYKMTPLNFEYSFSWLHLGCILPSSFPSLFAFLSHVHHHNNLPFEINTWIHQNMWSRCDIIIQFSVRPALHYYDNTFVYLLSTASLTLLAVNLPSVLFHLSFCGGQLVGKGLHHNCMFSKTEAPCPSAMLCWALLIGVWQNDSETCSEQFPC